MTARLDLSGCRTRAEALARIDAFVERHQADAVRRVATDLALAEDDDASDIVAALGRQQIRDRAQLRQDIGTWLDEREP